MNHNNAKSDNIATLLVEFMEVAITLLISIRGIYPQEAFERRRYLNVPVPWARHPELRSYINDAVTSLQSWIQKGIVEKLSVVIIDKDLTLLEKFVFSLKLKQTSSESVAIHDMEYSLRAFLLKLSVSEHLMQSLPTDCSWEILVYSKKLPGDASSKGHQWIPAETEQWEQPPLITPIKSMNSGLLDVQLYIEHPCK